MQKMADRSLSCRPEDVEQTQTAATGADPAPTMSSTDALSSLSQINSALKNGFVLIKLAASWIRGQQVERRRRLITTVPALREGLNLAGSAESFLSRSICRATGYAEARTLTAWPLSAAELSKAAGRGRRKRQSSLGSARRLDLPTGCTEGKQLRRQPLWSDCRPFPWKWEPNLTSGACRKLQSFSIYLRILFQ